MRATATVSCPAAPSSPPTGTALRLQTELGLTVTSCGHGPRGGDVTIAAAVAAGDVAAVIFFVDPGTAHPHQTDFNALIRQCCVHDVPVALNPSTARAVVTSLEHPADVVIPTARTVPVADPDTEWASAITNSSRDVPAGNATGHLVLRQDGHVSDTSATRQRPWPRAHRRA